MLCAACALALPGQPVNLIVRCLVTLLPCLGLNEPTAVSLRCFERFSNARPARVSLILSFALPALPNVFEPEATTIERVACVPEPEDQLIVSVPGVRADTLAW